MVESSEKRVPLSRRAGKVRAYAREYLAAVGFKPTLPFVQAAIDMAEEGFWAQQPIGSTKIRTAKIANRARSRGLTEGPFKKAEALGTDIYREYLEEGAIVIHNASQDSQARAAVSKAMQRAARRTLLEDRFKELLNPGLIGTIGNVNRSMAGDIVYGDKNTPTEIKEKIRTRTLSEPDYTSYRVAIEERQAREAETAKWLHLPDRSGRRLDLGSLLYYAYGYLYHAERTSLLPEIWQARKVAILDLLAGKPLLKADLEAQRLDLTDLSALVARIRTNYLNQLIDHIQDQRKKAKRRERGLP